VDPSSVVFLRTEPSLVTEKNRQSAGILLLISCS